ncbi:ROK family transcriptional regulator [Cellulomonas fengjieae]|uniref:ROK family transcriptional regulator n=1 Tax=Cellulomonas fengjieae TaxID=2819978 RepID=A0ABS3SFU8_9CELL|nr:ROK family transcriptional regulator [Cellulomonas fengjieae]MBO3084607.1 ROK family transcriptional regulator [Cellulomonas fengjieae]MBO3103379.1 ROK family transcriptional regulator [Cellulomonas fengjieae]QVI67064.1 ROK family transcriptional regulator [Cellulomonas fengjieae]
MTTTTQPLAAAHGVGRALRPTGKVLPEHARAHNRSLVLAHLFHVGPASRADIARSTGLTRVTVSGMVAALIAEGLVEELGVRVEGKVGKPATLVGMRTEAFQIVAVDLTDDTHLRGAVMTLVGAVLERRSVALDGRTGDAAAELLESLCRELLAVATRPVIGVGIASPGVIDLEGTVVQAPNRGWYDLPLAADLTESLGVPVHVANDANTRALGEFTYGSAAGSGCMVLTIGEGVGAGIVVDGALVLGRHHAAGEIGHVTVVDGDVRDEPPLDCACGRSGCLETVLSVPALRRRTAGLSREESDAALASVGRLLGIALAPVVSALDLAEVLLSGPPELLDGPLREAALATVRARTMPVIGHGLALRMGSLDEDGALAGAAVLVLSGQLGVS